MLYVTEAKLDEEEVENELLNIEVLKMAIEALQFQDIMINNPKTAKPTPEVCKTCMDNKQDNWVSDDLVSISTVLEIFSDLYWFDEDSLVVSKKDIDKIYERLRQIEPCKDGDTECTR